MTPTAATPTLSQQKEVLLRARASFEWFCRALWKIKDKDGNVVSFEPNPPQLRLIRLLVEKGANGRQVKCLILKARQMGFSTVCQAYLAWRAFCFKGQSGLTVAHLEEPSSELFGKIEFGWERLPDWFRPERDGKTRGKRLQLGQQHDKALLYVDHAKNKAAGRSQTFQNAHLSEVAFWDDARTIFTSMTPTLERAKAIFGESTANGLGGHFYDLWQGAEHGEGHPDWNGWHAFFAPWFEMPEYQRERYSIDRPLSGEEREYQRQFGLSDEQMLWRRDMIATMGEEDFRQEYPSTAQEAFLTSGSPFFTPRSLAYHREHVSCDCPAAIDGHLDLCDRKDAPKRLRTGAFHVHRGETRARFVDDPHGPIWVWELRQPEARYVVSADIASGGARDFTSIQVLKVGERLEQVATYRGKCDPDEAATLIHRLAKVYSPGKGSDRQWALVAPERNSFGQRTVDMLVNEFRYPNVYTHRRVDTVDYRESREYGWVTAKNTRNPSLEYLKELVRDAGILIRCGRTFQEMETFIYDESDKPIAPRGGFDDMVMALAIGVAVSQRVPTGPAVLYRPSNGDPISDAIGY